jgi:hypothetical protein
MIIKSPPKEGIFAFIDRFNPCYARGIRDALICMLADFRDIYP